MGSIPEECIRVCNRRKRKAIIYSTCTGAIVALGGGTCCHVLIGAFTIGLIVWWLYTPEVENCYKIYSPGGRR